MPLVHYIPSFYGDVRLEKLDEHSCRLITEKVTDLEKKALELLLRQASKKGWLISPSGALFSSGTLKTELSAPIDKVAKQLARTLKPTRKIVTAVRFSNGQMEEIVEPEGFPTASASSVANVKPVDEKPEPVAAASVAAPVRGCPSPEFEAAEIKARGVLAAFLDPDQFADFRRHNRFVSQGAVTGHHYMITSRQAKDSLARFQRTLYDLDEDRPLCVHDWSVPAAEEMLSLHLLVRLPGWELYLRQEEHDVEMSPELWA